MLWNRAAKGGSGGHGDEERKRAILARQEESERLEDMQAAVELHGRLGSGPAKGLRLGLLHGRLKTEEKEAVIMPRGKAGSMSW